MSRKETYLGLMKGFDLLFITIIFQITNIVCNLIGLSLFYYLSGLIGTVLLIVCLFKMSKYEEMYKRAVLLNVVSLVINQFFGLLEDENVIFLLLSLLTMVISTYVMLETLKTHRDLCEKYEMEFAYEWDKIRELIFFSYGAIILVTAIVIILLSDLMIDIYILVLYVASATIIVAMIKEMMVARKVSEFFDELALLDKEDE